MVCFDYCDIRVVHMVFSSVYSRTRVRELLDLCFGYGYLQMSFRKRGWVKRCIRIYKRLFVNVAALVFFFDIVCTCTYSYIYEYIYSGL